MKKIFSKIIVTADWHLRASKPRCRLDDNWIYTQKNALQQITDYAFSKRADAVCVIGDIFHSNKEADHEVISIVQDFALTLEKEGIPLLMLAGNHDLQYGNTENIKRTAFNVLQGSKNIGHIKDAIFPLKHSAFDFGCETENVPIIFKHFLVMPEEDRMQGIIDVHRPATMFRTYNKVRYMFTGDYHKSFIYTDGNKKLCNPGCLLRQASDFIDYAPSIMFFDFETGDVELLEIKDQADLVTDIHIRERGIKNERLDAFIESVKENKDAGFDFIDNVKKALANNQIEDGIQLAVGELLEGCQ